MSDAGYVGIDLHRRRSVIVQMDAAGEVLSKTRILNDKELLARELEAAGPDAKVVMEATYGWYWAADVVKASGAELHLAHPLGIKGFNYRRVKNDVRDATDLADLLRMHRLPEAWVATPEFRELRELVRHRYKLVSGRSALKNGIHAVLGKQGAELGIGDIFCIEGRRRLESIPLDSAFRIRVDAQLRLVDAYDEEVDAVDAELRRRLKGHQGYHAIQAIPGVGPVLAATMVAEIGDVSRFATPRHLCSWAGLTPKVRDSDTTSKKGRITKQGSRVLRWACIEAACRTHPNHLRAWSDQITERKGNRLIARTAVARKILTLAFYGLRDGEIRCLTTSEAT
jgi:transposase